MAKIKLLTIAKELNVSTMTCIDFLRSKGILIDCNNLNIKIEDKATELLYKEFGIYRESKLLLNSIIQAKRDEGKFYKGEPIKELWEDVTVNDELELQDRQIKNSGTTSEPSRNDCDIKKFAIVNATIESIEQDFIRVLVDNKKGVIYKTDIYPDKKSGSKRMHIGDTLRAKIIAVYNDTIVLSQRAVYGRMELSQTKENVYILDTNIFLIKPDILSIITTKYQVIIPNTVITEIDFRKNDNNMFVSTSARKSLRLINEALSIPNNVRAEQSDRHYCPNDSDYRSNDDKILAIAIKESRKGFNPIIMTNDIGLQAKAKANNITNISLDDFLNQGVVES